jgi:hypothetical protein
VRRAYCILALVTSAALHPADAQQLPFAVTIVDWKRDALILQTRLFLSRNSDREVLYCVESWKTLPADQGIERIIIEKVRQVRTGEVLAIVDIGAQCVGSKGESLPMIHTHNDGNCQFSATDLVTIVARRAQFDGVQCGERHFIWAFAWQVLAIANSVELAKLKEH